MPIIHHLDHSDSVETCIEAGDVNYPSVMIDGSKHPLEEDIRATREVVEYAHRKGATLTVDIRVRRGRSP